MFINEKRAATLMDEAGLDGLVGTRMENVFYLSGVWNMSQTMFPFDQQCYAIVTRDRLREPMVVISTGDWDQSLVVASNLRGTVHYGTFIRELREGNPLNAKETHLKEQIIDRSPHEDALAALVVALKEVGLADKRIGLDEKAFRPSYWPELEQRLPELEVEAAADLLRQIRAVKTNEEIRCLRRAAAATEHAIRSAVAIAGEGVTEQEMVRELQRSIVSQGGTPTFTMIRFGRNAALGQVPPDDTQLQVGDLIWFDVGCLIDGYWADIARTFVLGEPSAKLRRYYQAALDGEDQALEFTRPGVTAEQLFDETIKTVQEAGIPHYRRHHVGHGIGVEVYDPPLLAPGQLQPIESGMVINFETPYYELGWGAVHVEDPFVVREDGNELLTTLNRGLGIIPH